MSAGDIEGFAIDPKNVRAWKRYPAYKDSGVEWLGEVPVGWDVKRLRFLCSITTGEKNTEDHDPSGKYPFFVRSDNVERISTYSYDGEAVLTAGDGVGVAKVFHYYNGKFDVHQRVYRVTDFKNIIGHFLYYYIRENLAEEVLKLSAKTTVDSLRLPMLQNFPVLIPPLQEQKAIAAFLDRETTRLDALIAKKQRFIELLEEKRQAVINHAVTKGLDPDAEMKDSGVEWLGMVPAGWEVKKIRHSSTVKRGASPRPIDDPKYFDDFGEYGWVRISDVTASERYLEKTTQSLSDLGKSKSVPLEPGELILSMAGTVGKPIITKIKCCIHDGFVYFWGLKPDPEYLYYVFLTGELYKGIGKLGTQLNLNTDSIGDIKIPTPPLSEQHAIATFLDHETARIDTVIDTINQQIEILREHRTALISAAVTGKIDVRGEGGAA